MTITRRGRSEPSGRDRVGNSAIGAEAVSCVPWKGASLTSWLSARCPFGYLLEGTKGPSAEQFTALLRAVMQKKGDSLDGSCQELHGIPLASKSAPADSLERQFPARIADSSR